MPGQPVVPGVVQPEAGTVPTAPVSSAAPAVGQQAYMQQQHQVTGEVLYLYVGLLRHSYSLSCYRIQHVCHLTLHAPSVC